MRVARVARVSSLHVRALASKAAAPAPPAAKAAPKDPFASVNKDEAALSQDIQRLLVRASALSFVLSRVFRERATIARH